MRIPVGQFGYRTPGPGIAVDRSAQFDALGQVGDSLYGAGLQIRERKRRETAEREAKDAALRREKAHNRALDDQFAVETMVEGISDRVKRGELELDKAADTFESEFGRLQPLDLNGLDPITIENLQHVRETFRRNGRSKVATIMQGSQDDEHLAQMTEGLAKLQRAAGLPGASVESIIAKGREAHARLREAGVPQDVIAARQAGWETDIWQQHAIRRASDVRQSLGGLKALERELGSADGFYADKLDSAHRNQLLTSVRLEQDRIEDAMAREAEKLKKLYAEEAERTALEEVILGGGLLDPKDADQRKFVDSLFAGRSREAGFTRGDPNWQALAVETAARTGIVPHEVGGWLRGSAMSNDPRLAAMAAVTLDAMRDRNPQLLEYIDEDTKAFGLQVADMVDAGTPMELAVPIVRKNVYGTTPQERKLLDSKWPMDTKGKSPGNELKNLLDADDNFDVSMFAGAPTPPLGMVADFNALTRAYYDKTAGNLSRAQHLAYEDLQARWGRSEANGRAEIMRYPPEAFGVPGEKVRTELSAKYGESAGQIRLVSDRFTEEPAINRRTGQRDPISWALMEQDSETGELNVLPERYVLPTPADLKDEVTKRRQRAIRRARQVSDAELKRARESIETERTFPVGNPNLLDMRGMKPLWPARIPDEEG